MDLNDIVNEIKQKKSYLCIGLDSDIEKIPRHLLDFEDPVFEFNKRVIDATKDLVIAYKPNLAFYESAGLKGMISLEKTINYIPKNILKIADAKRGDIGNTSSMYAKTFFDTYNFDAVTLSPYMGKDSALPYLKYNKKWIILLALTSNSSAKEIQYLSNVEGKKLYESVIEDSLSWSDSTNMMYVVGANRVEDLKKIRDIVPDNFLLVPGVGAQGGSLNNLSLSAMNNNCGIIVNVSRSIIYSDSSNNFQEIVRVKALEIQKIMSDLLKSKGII